MPSLLDLSPKSFSKRVFFFFQGVTSHIFFDLIPIYHTISFRLRILPLVCGSKTRFRQPSKTCENKSNQKASDKYETHLFLNSFLMNIQDLKVQFNAKLWNPHPNLCFEENNEK